MTFAKPFDYVQHALTALKETTGLAASVLTSQVAEHDGRLAIKLSDGRVLELVYEEKANVDRLDQLSTFKSRHGHAVLVTFSLTRALAEECRQRNIQFLDTVGNCFLDQPGLFVYVTGRKPTMAGANASARGLAPATLRLMFAALSKPAILDNNVRRIGEGAGISHGAAGSALVTLEQMGLLSTSTAGRRMMLMPERWLDAWTEGYLGRIRPKLDTYRMSSSMPLASLLEHVPEEMHEILSGGERAAEKTGLGLKPGTLTLYIDLQQASIMRELVPALKLRRDPEGAIELVGIFWNTHVLPSFPTVPDALIYADLIGIGNERTIETAALLRKRIVDHVASEAG